MAGNPEDTIRAEGAVTITLAPEQAALAGLPPAIGPYRILGLIGEGGMGTVYEAVQENPRRIVALKVIKPGCFTGPSLRRFEHESQVLALLQHPGIAQIYEAGTAMSDHGPRPYFAMELVRGRMLLDHVAQQRTGTRERLELVARICDAVQHAHQKGIIHRDLKPGNILVDESGQPKVLDFGVARVTDSDIQATTVTDIGQIVGTVPYMSPEQVAADPSELDTRSDVYAVGVILFELLANRLPYVLRGKMITEAARVIREEEPPRLSSIDRSLRGDVETIAAKALEKDRSQRYASAADLAADIRRHLADKPIEARPHTLIYQAGKFAKRNKALVAGVVMAFAALAIGAVASTWQAVRAGREADRAREQESLAVAYGGFLSEMLERANPWELTRENPENGIRVTVRDALRASTRRLDGGELKDQPLAEAALRATIGNSYMGLGDLASSAPLLQRALALYQSSLGRDSAKAGEVIRSLAELRLLQGAPGEAESLARESLEIARRRSGGRSVEAATCLRTLGQVLSAQQRLPEAESLYRDALAIERTAYGDNHPEVARTLGSLARLLQEEGRLDEAEQMMREVLARQRSSLTDASPEVAATLHELGIMRRARGDLGGAESAMREAATQWRALLGDDHTFLAASLVNLGVLLREEGKIEEAEPLFREALGIQRAALGNDHPDVGATLYNLGKLLQADRRPAEAEPLIRDALRIQRGHLPADHPTLAATMAGLGSVLTTLRRPSEAEPLLRQALEVFRRGAGGTDWRRFQVMSLLGEALLGEGRYAAAEPFLLEGYGGLKDDPAVPPDRKRPALERIVSLYERWNAADPDPGRARSAARWRSLVKNDAGAH